MQFPVNLTLEIRTQEEYDRIQAILAALKAPKPAERMAPVPESDIELLDRAVMKLTDSSKEARVRINGHPISLGTTEAMTTRYHTECGIDSKCNIVLEEWRDGEYKSIATRRFQKFT